jgi:starch-binding outer membrane protein, SusD/RagB family
MKIRNMKKMTKVVLAVCATMGLGGCDLAVPDLNNPSIESFQQNPTRAGMAGAATGLLLGNRSGVSAQNGYVAHLGILGREAFVLDAADPRYITEMLAGSQLDPGSPAFGGSFWTAPYANIRNANTLLSVLDKVPGTTDEEREAVRGFTKTVQAMDYLTLINTRDSNGAVIGVDRPLGDELAPIESKEAVLAHIAMQLDEAKGHLEKGGESFPFPLSEGFAGLDTPADFLKFNRAIKARVDVYRAKWDEALVDVAASFIDPRAEADLNAGAWYTFSGNPGDTANGLNSPNIYANPIIVADADKQADGTVDARVKAKIRTVKSRTMQGITSDLADSLGQ